MTNLQCLNLVFETRNQIQQLLSLLQTLSQAFDLLLDTNHPRLTVVKPISLVYKQKNIRKPFSKNINESKWSSVSYLVVGTGEEPLPGLSIVLLLHSNLVYDSPTTGTPSRNAIFRIASV